MASELASVGCFQQQPSRIHSYLTLLCTWCLCLLRTPLLQADGKWCLVLEHCGRGTLDMLLHHCRSPLARAPQPRAAAAAGAGHTSLQEQQQHLTRPDVVKLLPLIRGVVRGLLHLHSRRPAILHRDVKPANIMIGHGMQVTDNRLSATSWQVPRQSLHCFGSNRFLQLHI